MPITGSKLHVWWFTYVFLCPFFTCRPAFTTKTSLNAEWEKNWKELDFEGDLSKLQKEAEKRLDDKIAELVANIEKAGSTGN